jgi:hypothetical protein
MRSDSRIHIHPASRQDHRGIFKYRVDIKQRLAKSLDPVLLF